MQPWYAADKLLSTMPAGYVDKQQQPPCVSSIDTAAQAASRRSAANASSVTFTAHVGS